MQDISIAFVFVSNIAAILLLTFLLFRILGQTRDTQRMMLNEGRKLEEAAKRLVNMLGNVDRLSERLLETHKLADVQGDPNQGEISSQSAAPLAAPASNSQRENEIGQLKQQIEDANELITQLRLANRPADVGPKPADILREELAQQKSLTEKIKERAQKAEESAKSVKLELAQLNAHLTQSDSESKKELMELRQQLTSRTQESNNLQRQRDELQDSMKRTLLEKNFIEEKLLEFDVKAHPPNTLDVPS